MIVLVLDVLGGVAIGSAAAGYAVMRRRLRDRGVPQPVWRLVSFDTGLAIVAVSLAGPLDAGASTSFLLHSVQHVLLAMVAPPLLILADPLTLFLQGTREPQRRRLRKLVALRPVAVLTNPVAAFVLFAGGFAVLYLSPLYAASLRSDLVHALVHFHLLAAGAVLAAVVLGGAGVAQVPHAARLFLVLGTIPAHSVVGLALLAMRSPISGSSGPVPPFGWEALTDQRAGAALMWVLGELVAVALVGLVLVRWRAAEERAGARHDRATGRARVLPVAARHGATGRAPEAHDPMRYQ